MREKKVAKPFQFTSSKLNNSNYWPSDSALIIHSLLPERTVPVMSRVLWHSTNSMWRSISSWHPFFILPVWKCLKQLSIYLWLPNISIGHRHRKAIAFCPHKLRLWGSTRSICGARTHLRTGTTTYTSRITRPYGNAHDGSRPMMQY